MTFEQLEILISFSENKTLLGTSRALHISQPALTISMKKLENELKTTIFDRKKNRLSLNENGKYAVTLAKNILKTKNDMVEKMQSYGKTNTVLKVGMSAIAPRLYLLPNIEKQHKLKIISTIEPEDMLIRKLRNDLYNFIFTNNKIDIKNFICKKLFSEQLYFFLPLNHPYAKKKSISFKDMDGESLLMNREIGFWDELVRENMPHSNFILQDNLDNLRILIDNSNVASFASNFTLNERNVPTRTAIKISNPSAKVDFYLSYNQSMDKKLLELFKYNN